MSLERVIHYFEQFDIADRICVLSDSSATVALAAAVIGCAPKEIAKTMSFYTSDRTAALLVVTAGDQKIDNKKFKETFGMKARMLALEDVEAMTGHAPGGVCPFANPDGVPVYLDVSLKRFETVFPAAGSANSAIELTCDQLETYSQAEKWVDVCRCV